MFCSGRRACALVALRPVIARIARYLKKLEGMAVLIPITLVGDVDSCEDCIPQVTRCRKAIFGAKQIVVVPSVDGGRWNADSACLIWMPAKLWGRALGEVSACVHVVVSAVRKAACCS